MPFIILEDGIPQFKRGPSLVLEQERQYLVWFFGEPQKLFARNMRREWTGQSRREQNLLMRQIAESRKQQIEQ